MTPIPTACRGNSGGRIYIETKQRGVLKLYIQHSSKAWFNQETVDWNTSIDGLRKAHSLGEDRQAKHVSGQDPKTVGVLFWNDTCHDLFFLKRLKSRRLYDNDRGQVDTIVKLWSCGLGDFDAVAFMNRFDFMSESDRAVIRARTDQSD